MRVLIYGGGAVGLALASFMIKSGTKVSILARPDTVDALRESGLLRTGIFGELRAAPDSFQAFSMLSQVPPDPPFDVICVCVKSFDSEAAALDLARHRALLGPSGKIVLFQNGWGNKEVFAPQLPPARIFNARVITGFRRPEINHVDITVHAEPVALGSLDGVPFDELTTELEPLRSAIDGGGYPCRISPDVGKDIWAKILYNCALNPLGAMMNVPYGVLAEHDETRRIMDGVIEEIYAVMAPAKFSTHWPTASEYRKVFYERLVPTTAAHYSSTLQDLQAGRRTEIDALSGAIVRLGSTFGIEVPVNSTLYDMVRFLEKRKT